MQNLFQIINYFGRQWSLVFLTKVGNIEPTDKDEIIQNGENENAVSSLKLNKNSFVIKGTLVLIWKLPYRFVFI